MRLRLLAGAGVCAVLAGCGSVPPAATPSSAEPDFAPFSSTPPAAVGNGVACGVAADRVLKIHDHLDLGAFRRGPTSPGNSLIQEAIAQYVGSHSSAERERAAGLIVGQCAAYGFYIITYRECLQPSVRHGIAPTAAIRSCIERRRWTVYTQQ